jgi:indolepyruvate ferredoxin oxidoreductase beta subunit
MNYKTFNIVVSGVGGQGVILATEILGDAALSEGLDVTISEIHGMAHRGGSVVSHVRIGSEAYSPTITEGEADVILGFEPIETLRVLRFANKETRIIMNSKQIIPLAVSTGAYKYPSIEQITEQCKTFTEHVTVLDAFKIAGEAGNPKTANVVLLGALTATGLLPIKEEDLIQAIKRHVPERSVSENLNAFHAGKAALRREMLNSQDSDTTFQRSRPTATESSDCSS